MGGDEAARHECEEGCFVVALSVRTTNDAYQRDAEPNERDCDRLRRGKHDPEKDH